MAWRPRRAAPDGIPGTQWRLMVNRVAHVYDPRQLRHHLPPLARLHTVTTTTTREYKIASISVPGPCLIRGFPSPSSSRRLPQRHPQRGSHHHHRQPGQIAVMPPAGSVTPSTPPGCATACPSGWATTVDVHAARRAELTPASRLSVDGLADPRHLRLLLRRGGYVFSGTGPSFRVLAFPAMR